MNPPATPGLDLLSIGECMVEFARRGPADYGLAFGGDTFNTAVYAARLGLSVGYGTALGDDPYSQAILDLAAEETVGTSLIPRIAGRVPGLYVIETDDAGERRFFYWRDSAPARTLFERPEGDAVAAAMARARCVYCSGITLSLYASAGLDRFVDALATAREAGATIAFDGNFRPRGWGGDLSRARAAFGRVLARADIVLPTFDDEAALWGDSSPDATAERLLRLGVREVAVKSGPDGVLLATGTGREHVPVPSLVRPVDTTAAGDSFNAGYLAGRLKGRQPGEAALLGHRLAAIVIAHRGAIVPRAATAGLAADAMQR